MQKSGEADLILQMIGSVEKAERQMESAFDSNNFGEFFNNKKTLMNFLENLEAKLK